MEIEAKFIIPDAATAEAILATDRWGSFNLTAAETQQVKDTYVDTPDHRLRAAGYACRYRETGEGVLVTLKSLGEAQDALHQREELEAHLPSEAPPSAWPAGPVRAQVLQIIGETPLTPLVTLHQERCVRQAQREGRAPAEISLDHVRLTARGQAHTFYELEIELLEVGCETDLEALATHARQTWQLEAARQSKLARALALVEASRQRGRLLTGEERALLETIARMKQPYRRRARALLGLDDGLIQRLAGAQAGLSERRVRYWLAEFRRRRLEVFPPAVLAQEPLLTDLPEPLPSSSRKARKPPKRAGLKPDDSMPQAARKVLKLQYRHMLYNEPGTRRGEDIEALHDMRVAIRRMRAAFRVFGDYIDMTEAGPALKGLRRTGRILGAVRDLDVFWEKVQHYLETLPEGAAGDLEPLHTEWVRKRSAARQRMLAYLDSKRYRKFKHDFEALCQASTAWEYAAFNAKGEPRPYRLRHVVPAAVLRRLVAVLAYDEWVSAPDVPVERLHQLRIAAKRLRYSLEFFQEVLKPHATQVIEQIKTLQDHLGDLQDAVVANQILESFLTRGTWGEAPATGASSKPEHPQASGVVAYQQAKQQERQHLVTTFPQVWDQIASPEFVEAVTSSFIVARRARGFHLQTHTPDTEKGMKMNTQTPLYIILLGPPASGKGTQAAKLRAYLKLAHVASGDLFREHLKNNTALGKKARAYMDRGELVPDDVTITMVLERLNQPDTQRGVLLDGFPRTIAQAEALDQALAEKGLSISLVPSIAVPDDVLVERVSGRRLCPVCGESYHVRFNPPKEPGVCDKDGAKLYQRDDDRPETVRKRLQVYHEQTAPLIDYYRRKGLLVEINGDQPIEAVQADIRQVIEDRT